MVTRWHLLVVATVGLFSTGCVRRTISISTTPSNARVFLNDQEIGRSDVSTDFVWYGDYDVVIRKEGCKTLKTNWPINPPWYQYAPLDFFAEVFWPWQVHDRHARHFDLEPQDAASPEEVVERALETRDRAFQAGQ